MDQRDKTLISQLDGDGLSKAAQAQLLRNFYKTLHMQMAMVLEDLLSDEQLEEFAKIDQAGDQVANEAWFKAAVPNYDKIVDEQTNILKQDIKQRTATVKSIIDES